MRPARAPTRSSSRLLRLVAADLPDHRREGEENGWARFVGKDGVVIEVASRIEKRFLGRTEVAVFAVSYPVLPGEFEVVISHGGRLKRSGLRARPLSGGVVADEVAARVDSDTGLTHAALPLDFTRFELAGDDHGCRACVELVGASHVGIAFPPIRSYVRLYPDQRKALLETFAELGRLLSSNR